MGAYQIKAWWDYIQSLLDIDGDVIMLVFTAAVIYKLLKGNLTACDAGVYASAVSAFAYSNRGQK